MNNKEKTVIGVRYLNHDALEEAGTPAGAFSFYGSTSEKFAGMFICCPKCSHLGFIRFLVTHKLQSRWFWDGNEDAPTLKPSLNNFGCCGWHGWLKNGVFTPVSEKGQ